MKREEALQILDTIPTISEQVDALEMAIQALSQEQKIKAIVVEWQSDTWTDNFSYECMRKIADIVAESEE